VGAGWRAERRAPGQRDDMGKAADKGMSLPPLARHGLGAGKRHLDLGNSSDGLGAYAYAILPVPFSFWGASREPPVEGRSPPTSLAHGTSRSRARATPARDAGMSFPRGRLLDRAPGRRILLIVRHPSMRYDRAVRHRQGLGHHTPGRRTGRLGYPVLADRCAHQWSYLNNVGFAQVEPVATVLRFEQMIADKTAFGASRLRGRGVSTGTHHPAPRHQDWAARVQDTKIRGLRRGPNLARLIPSRPRPASAGWSENLSPRRSNSVWQIVETAAGRFGY